MSKIVELPVITKLDIPVERILRRAQEADLESAVVIGFTADGDFWFSSTQADGGDVIWLLEKAKLELLQIDLAAE